MKGSNKIHIEAKREIVKRAHRKRTDSQMIIKDDRGSEELTETQTRTTEVQMRPFKKNADRNLLRFLTEPATSCKLSNISHLITQSSILSLSYSISEMENLLRFSLKHQNYSANLPCTAGF